AYAKPGEIMDFAPLNLMDPGVLIAFAALLASALFATAGLIRPLFRSLLQPLSLAPLRTAGQGMARSLARNESHGLGNADPAGSGK
ncbi:hypothetical protein LJC59_07775, partial [Desulfovibrio sp. OttesenSCG-928-A18]|nr:hypothetical protein [Desulfovibrio sp. OttesenSCG-928-A18]